MIKMKIPPEQLRKLKKEIRSTQCPSEYQAFLKQVLSKCGIEIDDYFKGDRA
jgi:hypothetical protein